MGRDFFPRQSSGAKEGLEKKQAFITQSIERKEVSMREFAVRRDSALFASVSAGDNATQERLKEEYEQWLKFFGEAYGNNG